MCSCWLLVFYKDLLKFQQVVSEPPLLLDYWNFKLFDFSYTWITLVIWTLFFFFWNNTYLLSVNLDISILDIWFEFECILFVGIVIWFCERLLFMATVHIVSDIYIYIYIYISENFLRMQFLIFFLLKKGKSNIRKYMMKMSNLPSKLEALNLELGEDWLMHLVLISLPTSFGQFKVSYNTHKDK